MSQSPLFHVLHFRKYDKNMVVKLVEQSYPGFQQTTDRQQILYEWQIKAKYDLLQWKENNLLQTVKDVAWLQLQICTSPSF